LKKVALYSSSRQLPISAPSDFIVALFYENCCLLCRLVTSNTFTRRAVEKLLQTQCTKKNHGNLRFYSRSEHCWHGQDVNIIAIIIPKKRVGVNITGVPIRPYRSIRIVGIFIANYAYGFYTKG